MAAQLSRQSQYSILTMTEDESVTVQLSMTLVIAENSEQITPTHCHLQSSHRNHWQQPTETRHLWLSQSNQWLPLEDYRLYLQHVKFTTTSGVPTPIVKTFVPAPFLYRGIGVQYDPIRLKSRLLSAWASCASVAKSREARARGIIVSWVLKEKGRR